MGADKARLWIFWLSMIALIVSFLIRNTIEKTQLKSTYLDNGIYMGYNKKRLNF